MISSQMKMKIYLPAPKVFNELNWVRAFNRVCPRRDVVQEFNFFACPRFIYVA